MSSTSPDQSVNHQPHQNRQPNQSETNPTKNLPAIALKWGKTPKQQTEEEKARWKDYYSEEEQAEMRQKGVNPALKAEIEDSKKRHGGGFWSKVAQTSLGGGWIK